MHLKLTEKNLALTVPVASVPTFLKLVPQVKTNDVVPDVVIANVTICPVTPPLALNVQAPVGVIVITLLVIGTVIVPLVAGVAADSELPPFANGSVLITFVSKSMLPARSAFVIEFKRTNLL